MNPRMKCCVANCANQMRFTFPKNEDVRKQWLEAIRRPNFKPKYKHGLCADHFRPEDIPTESYSGGYKTERVVLRRHIVPTVFSWTKSVRKREKKIVKNVGNEVEIKTENLEEYNIDTSYDNCLENLTDNPFQTVYIKSECYEPIDIVKGDAQIYKQIENNDNVNHFQVSEEVIVKTEEQPEKSNVECSYQSEINDESHLYIESDMRLLEHDYHVAKMYQVRTQFTNPRYDIEEFRIDPQGLKVFTGLGSYDRFMEVFRKLGEKVYKLDYSGNKVTGKLSVKNQFFLTLWKLKRNISEFDLSRHFNISTVAVGNVFRTWVRFLAIERPKIEIRPGRDIFEYYKLNRFEKYYAEISVASASTDGSKLQKTTKKT